MQLNQHWVSECKSDCDCCAVDGKIVLSSRKQLICETPLLKQVYDQLAAAGKTGLSIVELAKQLGLQRLDCRTLMKNICRKGLAVFMLHEQGKAQLQRSVLYALSVIGAVIVQGSCQSLKALEFFFRFSRPVKSLKRDMVFGSPCISAKKSLKVLGFGFVI